MAKVEMEDRCFREPRLILAVSKHRVPASAILGYVAVLWRMSQQEGVVIASRDEIRAWLDTDRYAKPDRAIDWLVTADFLRPLEGDRFEISGNDVAVPKAQRRIASAVAAVRAREDKRSNIDSMNDQRSNRSSSRSSFDHPDRNTGGQDNKMTVGGGVNTGRAASTGEEISGRAIAAAGRCFAELDAVMSETDAGGRSERDAVIARLAKACGDDWPSVNLAIGHLESFYTAFKTKRQRRTLNLFRDDFIDRLVGIMVASVPRETTSPDANENGSPIDPKDPTHSRRSP